MPIFTWTIMINIQVSHIPYQLPRYFKISKNWVSEWNDEFVYEKCIIAVAFNVISIPKLTTFKKFLSNPNGDVRQDVSQFVENKIRTGISAESKLADSGIQQHLLPGARAVQTIKVILSTQRPSQWPLKVDIHWQTKGNVQQTSDITH